MALTFHLRRRLQISSNAVCSCHRLRSQHLLCLGNQARQHQVRSNSPLVPTTSVRTMHATGASWSRPTKHAVTPPPLYLTKDGESSVQYCKACGRVMSKWCLGCRYDRDIVPKLALWSFFSMPSSSTKPCLITMNVTVKSLFSLFDDLSLPSLTTI